MYTCLSRVPVVLGAAKRVASQSHADTCTEAHKKLCTVHCARAAYSQALPGRPSPVATCDSDASSDEHDSRDGTTSNDADAPDSLFPFIAN